MWFIAAAFFSGSSSEHHLADSLKGIHLTHPLGCDTFGRDMLATILRGSLTSAAFALFTTITAIFLAIVIGGLTALTPKTVQFMLSRLLDLFLAFPSLLFALGWAVIRGPGWSTLIFALMIESVPSLTRLVHVRIREILTHDYIEAAKNLGADSLWIMKKHLVPPVLSICMVKLPNLFAHALMAEATLSFLGLGAPLGKDTWGSLLAQGKEYLIEAPHIALTSGFPLVLTVLSLQVLSERLSTTIKGLNTFRKMIHVES